MTENSETLPKVLKGPARSSLSCLSGSTSLQSEPARSRKYCSIPASSFPTRPSADGTENAAPIMPVACITRRRRKMMSGTSKPWWKLSTLWNALHDHLQVFHQVHSFPPGEDYSSARRGGTPRGRAEKGSRWRTQSARRLLTACGSRGPSGYTGRDLWADLNLDDARPRKYPDQESVPTIAELPIDCLKSIKDIGLP